jgi:hypothetical protein
MELPIISHLISVILSAFGKHNAGFAVRKKTLGPNAGSDATVPWTT